LATLGAMGFWGWQHGDGILPITTTINQRAPVIAAGEIEVKAVPEVVWDIMVAIEQWPAWNPDVT
jgi:hypothetical protein